MFAIVLGSRLQVLVQCQVISVLEEHITSQITTADKLAATARDLMISMGGRAAFSKMSDRSKLGKKYSDQMESLNQEMQRMFDKSVQQAKIGFTVAVGMARTLGGADGAPAAPRFGGRWTGFWLREPRPAPGLQDVLVLLVGMALIVASAALAMARNQVASWAGVGASGGLGVLSVLYAFVSKPRAQARISLFAAINPSSGMPGASVEATGSDIRVSGQERDRPHNDD